MPNLLRLSDAALHVAQRLPVYAFFLSAVLVLTGCHKSRPPTPNTGSRSNPADGEKSLVQGRKGEQSSSTKNIAKSPPHAKNSSIASGSVKTVPPDDVASPVETISPNEARLAPALTGRRLGLAQQFVRLAELEMEQGVFYIAPQNWRDDLRPGVVYMQSPQPNTPLEKGGAVACWTFEQASGAQKIIHMPDLRGLNPQEAASQIEALNLTILTPISSPREDRADQAANHTSRIVAEQYPKPSQAVYEKTGVYLRWRVPANET